MVKHTTKKKKATAPKATGKPAAEKKTTKKKPVKKSPPKTTSETPLFDELSTQSEENNDDLGAEQFRAEFKAAEVRFAETAKDSVDAECDLLKANHNHRMAVLKYEDVRAAYSVLASTGDLLLLDAESGIGWQIEKSKEIPRVRKKKHRTENKRDDETLQPATSEGTGGSAAAPQAESEPIEVEADESEVGTETEEASKVDPLGAVEPMPEKWQDVTLGEASFFKGIVAVLHERNIFTLGNLYRVVSTMTAEGKAFSDMDGVDKNMVDEIGESWNQFFDVNSQFTRPDKEDQTPEEPVLNDEEVSDDLDSL